MGKAKLIFAVMLAVTLTACQGQNPIKGSSDLKAEYPNAFRNAVYPLDESGQPLPAPEKPDEQPFVTFRNLPTGKLSFGSDVEFQVLIVDNEANEESAPIIADISFPERKLANDATKVDGARAVDCEETGRAEGHNTFVFNCKFASSLLADVQPEGTKVEAVFYVRGLSKKSGLRSAYTPAFIVVEFEKIQKPKVKS